MKIAPDCGQRKTDGRRCQSPALRGRTHCFYHGPTRRTPRLQSCPIDLQGVFDLETLQCAYGQLLQAIAAGKLTDRRAALLLNALRATAATFA